MDNIINISQDSYRRSTRDHVRTDSQNTSNGTTENPAPLNTRTREADIDQSYRVEISNSHPGTVNSNHAVPEDNDAAAVLLAQIKERLAEEAAVHGRGLEHLHNLRPGNLIDLLS